MEDRLPNINIKVDTSPKQFLERIESIAFRLGSLRCQLHTDFGGVGYHILDVIPEISSPHDELVGQLIVLPDLNTRVLVEIRASRWNPDPPTYDAYVDAAKCVFNPLLQLYNKSFHSRCRLNIQSKENLQPSLPPRATEFFNEFVISANKKALHPFDWERFYRLIYVCSPRNIEITHDDVKRLLVSSGFTLEYADYLSDIFIHGRDLLRFTRN